MNSDHIKEVFKNYLNDPNEQFAILINGGWGSGKTYFWEKELKPIAETEGKKTLYISLNGINNRGTLEQIVFIKLWGFLNQGDNKRKTQFAQIFANALGILSKKKLNVNLPDLLRGLSLDTIIYTEHLICFDDLERCQMPQVEVLGFINDFVEHRKLKTLILSDETKINESQPDFFGIKEKVVGRTFNFHIDLELILPQLIQKYAGDTELFVFFEKYETFIRDLLQTFKENNLRIIDFCLSAIARMYPILKDQNQDSIRDVFLCTLTVAIDYKKGFLRSEDEGSYKELNMLTIVQRLWSQPDQGSDPVPTELIKSAYPKAFFDRYLKNLKQQFNLWESVFDFILSGYLNQEQLTEELARRDPENIPEYVICFSLLINYKFRTLSDEDFTFLVDKTHKYAEEGLYTIYDYLQIADFYFYFSDNGLIHLSYDEILVFVRKGLAKSAQRWETNDNSFKNMLHFQKTNPTSEKFKEEISMLHITIIRERNRNAMSRISSFIKDGNNDEITKGFDDYRFDKDFLPSIDVAEFCHVLKTAPNKAISQLATIFEERYNSGTAQLLCDDDSPLKEIDLNIGLILEDIEIGPLRRFVIEEMSKAIKTGLGVMENLKKKN